MIKPPVTRSRSHSAWRWAREGFFASWWQTLLTLAAFGLIVEITVPLLRWAVIDARLGDGPDSCEAATGACWSFIADNLPLFLFGTYPAEERWRPLLCLAAVLVTPLLGFVPSFRTWRFWIAISIGLLVLSAILLRGHPLLGLPPVSSTAWGGLVLTLLLSAIGIALSFPLGVLLALGRRSRTLPAIRIICTGFIELIRAVPLVSILFLASVLVPLFLPQDMQVDNLLRAQVGIIVFQAAYMAEVVRGGLQTIPPGQEQAAMALGLGYFKRMRLVVLPQALRKVIPALVNQVIIIIKDTSLVVVIGMFDLLGIAEVAVRNVVWSGRNFEAYAFVGAIYWTICFSISRVSRRLERHA